MSSQTEIDMRPGGENPSEFHPLSPADSSAGTDFPFQNLAESLNQKMDRRTVLKRGAGLLAGSMLAAVRLSKSEEVFAEANADILAGDGIPQLDQEVPLEVEDPRTFYMDLPKIDSHESLRTRPVHLNILKIKANPDLDKIVRQNRLGAGIWSGLAHADAISQLLDPETEDTSPLLQLYEGISTGQRDLPIPDATDFFLRMKSAKESGQPLWLLVDAITPDSPNQTTATRADLTKGMDVLYVADEGIIPNQKDQESGEYIDSFTFSVDKNQLTMMICINGAILNNQYDGKWQEWYDFMASDTIGRGLRILGTSLGKRDSSGNLLHTSVVNQAMGTKLINREIFPELNKFFVGDFDAEKGMYPETAVKVTFVGK